RSRRHRKAPSPPPRSSRSSPTSRRPWGPGNDRNCRFRRRSPELLSSRSPPFLNQISRAVENEGNHPGHQLSSRPTTKGDSANFRQKSKGILKIN
ncbi:hypothetical protein Prudu_004272, partial [Prunus dulcis]